MTVRRDRRGRRIGYNWWREFVMAAYSPAREAWEQAFEEATHQSYRPGIIAESRRETRRGGRNEVMDFVTEHPPPTLKAFLTEYAGMSDRAA